MSSAVEWIENKFSGSDDKKKKEGLIANHAGGGISPGFIAVCFAFFCPWIYPIINCTAYKGGWGDVGYAYLVIVIWAALVSVHPAFGIIWPIGFVGMWTYSSMNGVEDFLCPISAPGGLRKKSGGGRKKMGGKSKKMGGKRKY